MAGSGETGTRSQTDSRPNPARRPSWRGAIFTTCGLSTASLIALTQIAAQDKPVIEVWNGREKNALKRAVDDELDQQDILKPKKSVVETRSGKAKIYHLKPSAESQTALSESGTHSWSSKEALPPVESLDNAPAMSAKEIAIRLMSQARMRAEQGNLAAARLLATRANSYAVTWEFGEDSPDEFLEELDSLKNADSPFTKPVSSETPFDENDNQEADLGVWSQPVTSEEFEEPKSPAEALPPPLDFASPPVTANVVPPDEAPLPPVATEEIDDRKREEATPAPQPTVVVLRDQPTASQPAPQTSQSDVYASLMVNLIAVFAALVGGLFVLVCALVFGLKRLASGTGMAFRVELVNNSPPVTYPSMPDINITLPPGIAAPNASPVVTKEEEHEHRPLRAVDFGDGSFPFPFVQESFEERKQAAEEELKAREEAMLKFIFEQNMKLRDDLNLLPAA